MLVTMATLLEDAQKEQYAFAAINVYSWESIHGALLAAQAANTPVILAFAARYQKHFSLAQVAAMVKACAETIDIPYALHLDHCGDLQTIKNALQAGFSSVMFDGSHLSFEENCAQSKEAAEVAHAFGASVEAELGAIATGYLSAESTGDVMRYTDPQQAAQFVQATGIDALAVSIGTVHGMYTGTPNIRLDILDEIHRQVDIPLVLHGGSDTGDSLLVEMVRRGIRKVNINTEISLHCVERARQLLQENSKLHLSDFSAQLTSFFMEAALRFIKILRSFPVNE